MDYPHAVEFFAGFFIPFYFFRAGLSLSAENFSWKALQVAAILLIVVVPFRIFSVAWHRHLALGEPTREALRTGLALIPTLVFTLVLAEILRERFSASPELIGGLVIFTIVNTMLPTIVLRKSVSVTYADVHAA